MNVVQVMFHYFNFLCSVLLKIEQNIIILMHLDCIIKSCVSIPKNQNSFKCCMKYALIVVFLIQVANYWDG